jgi:hypothetical protein
MSNYEEIKKLVESSRRMLSTMNESTKEEIRQKHGLINEQVAVEEKKEYEVAGEKKDSEDIGKPRDKQKAYKIQGNVLVLHGKEQSDIQLTTDEKNAFTESVDEFRSEVAELVEFEKMSVFPENVEWSGKILELDLEFFYTINEPHGIYINGQMVKVDQEYLEMVSKIQSYYEKFKNKWSKIVASRQESI